ncbi:carbohydrate esterase family 16 protein [Gelatoporia subvermispora B]|uniref:Carbohydrate esterase family 16 protein n=1 Tax=Ceriporiopsis subvermispora (strain B) TaxID=914234 RepID=M2QX00_CERS8|nr:carbohydrate esterase family 16 protein [Gelatoporia subvermispora B]
MPQAAQVILNQIQILAAPPTNARAFLITDVYGRGAHSAWGEAYKQSIYSGLAQYHDGTNISAPINWAFANFAHIWDGVLDGPPGYRAFGYTNTSACTTCNDDGCTMVGMCDDAEHYFYWIPGHPSKEGMRIMADYVEEVLARCTYE